MALWMPLLAVVNFIITLFGTQSFSGQIVSGGGLTAQNSGVISQSSNNLVLAAEFLGTMVPMLAWGIVNGTLAFTEFIAHGIGSSFAVQAGATAAAGNLSLGNMSMNNNSSNKFNPAMSSTVGAQEVNAFDGAGSGLFSAQLGGSITTEAGAVASMSKSMAHNLSSQASSLKALSETVSQTWNKTHSIAAVLQAAGSEARQSGHTENLGFVKAAVFQAMHQAGIVDSHGHFNNTGHGQDSSGGASTKIGGGLKLDGWVTAELGGSADAKLGHSFKSDSGTNSGTTSTTGDSQQQSASTSVNGGVQQISSMLDGLTKSQSNALSTSFSNALGKSESSMTTLSESYQRAASVADSFSYNQSTDPTLIGQEQATLTQMQGALESATKDIGSGIDAGTKGLSAASSMNQVVDKALANPDLLAGLHNYELLANANDGIGVAAGNIGNNYLPASATTDFAQRQRQEIAHDNRESDLYRKGALEMFPGRLAANKPVQKPGESDIVFNARMLDFDEGH
jgi:hypothetical protein